MAQNELILKKLLAQIAIELNFNDYDVKIEAISSGGANYTSVLYNITITEGDKVVHMFSKVAALGEKMRSTAPRIYDIESLVYIKILTAYERLQDEHQIPKENRLGFTKFYGYNPNTYEETIVLENLVAKGYETYDRFKSVDWEYTKAALRELATLHALAFAYNEYYPEDFNETVKELKDRWICVDDDLNAYYDGTMRKAVEVTQQKNKEKLRTFFDGIRDGLFDNIYSNWVRRPVLGHGDYRTSNLLHKVRDDGTIDIKIVDFQTMQGNCPVIDLLYFIVTGTDEEFRANYFQKSLDHYFSHLQAAMQRLHLDPDKIYSREDFEYELKEKLPYGLPIAAATLPVVTVDAENAPAVNEDTEMSAFSVQNTSDLYTERMNGLVNDYVRWGIFK